MLKSSLMSVEQAKNIEFSNQVTNLSGKAVLAGEHLAGPFLRYGLENILTNTNVDYEYGFENDYIQNIREGYLPILVGNHQSHIDGITISLVSRTLTGVANEQLPSDKKIKGFALVLASSLYSGHQGAMMKGFFDETSPIIEKRGLFPVLHTRPKDRTEYKMRAESVGQFKELVDMVRDSFALVAFPEGTTTAGKTNTDGQPNGMQDFLPSSVRMLIGAALEGDRKAMIIPVSLSGGPKIYSPDTKLPTVSAIRAGFNLGESGLLRVYVSKPMLSDQGDLGKLYKNRDWERLNTLVALKIADHLPINEKGKYI